MATRRDTGGERHLLKFDSSCLTRTGGEAHLVSIHQIVDLSERFRESQDSLLGVIANGHEFPTFATVAREHIVQLSVEFSEAQLPTAAVQLQNLWTHTAVAPPIRYHREDRYECTAGDHLSQPTVVEHDESNISDATAKVDDVHAYTYVHASEGWNEVPFRDHKVKEDSRSAKDQNQAQRRNVSG